MNILIQGLQLEISAEFTNKVIEVKSTPQLFKNGEYAGKSNGDVNHEVFVNKVKRGEILSFGYQKTRYQVISDTILGKYKAKYFKTFNGAKKFLIESKERYIPIDQIDLLTRQRRLPQSSLQEDARKHKSADEWFSKSEKFSTIRDYKDKYFLNTFKSQVNKEWEKYHNIAKSESSEI